MNKNLAVPNEANWPLGPHAPGVQSAAAPGQRGYTASNILDIATVLRIIYEWRWLVLSAVAAGVAGAIIVTLMTTPLYRAWVTLEANPPTVSVSDDQDTERERSQDSYNFVRTQIGLLTSKSVAERTAQDLNLVNNPNVVDPESDASTRLQEATGAVSANLAVAPPNESSLIRFSYDSPSPQLAAMIANGIADSFINSALQRRYEASAYARNFLQRQIAKTRADLERSERAQVGYAQAQGIINTAAQEGQTPGDTNSLQGESLLALNRALADATARRVAAEGAYRQGRATGPTSDVTASTSALRGQRATLEAQYQQKRTFMKPDHPEMLSLRSQISELDKQISRESSQMSSGRNNTLSADYRSALSAENALRSRVAQLKGAVLDLRGRSVRYNILQREVDTNRSLYDALLQRYKEIGVAGGVGISPVSVVDRANPPQGPYKPSLLFNLAVGLGLGLLAGVAGAIGIEFLNDTIKTREDVRRKLALACLGAVPRTVAKNSFVEDLKNPTSIVSEAYSAIVAALRFSTESGTPKVFAVTSSGPSEGKSSSALALAQNFARRDNRVLLIDADLRKPAFKAATDKVGLSKLLTTDEGIQGHVLETQHDNLWLLPSGPVPPNAADLLATARIRKIIAEAVERFDIVLIDGPPTLGLADAPLLAAATKNILFVVESGKTRTRTAIEALNRLEATGAHILGVALTKANSDDLSGYGGYGYGYGYGLTYGQGTADAKRTEILLIPHNED
jgi:succinoglycan biosynthesis transport protein ExoP